MSSSRDSRIRRLPEKLQDPDYQYELISPTCQSQSKTQSSCQQDESPNNKTLADRDFGQDTDLQVENKLENTDAVSKHLEITDAKFQKLEDLLIELRTDFHETVGNLNSEIVVLKHKTDELENDITVLKKQDDQKSKEISGLKKKIQDMNTKITSLESSFETRNLIETRNKGQDSSNFEENVTDTSENVATSPNEEDDQFLQVEGRNKPSEVFMLVDSTARYIDKSKLMGKKKVTISNVGTILNTLDKISRWKDCAETRFVIIQCGVNDLKTKSVTDVQETIKSLMRILQEKYPNAKIVFSCLVVRNKEHELYDKMVQLNRNIKSYCIENDGIMFVDHKNLHHKQNLFLDGIHPSEDGTKLIVANLHRQLLPRPKAAAVNSGDKIKKRIERPFGRRTEATNNTDVKIDTLCQMIKTILQG